MVPDGGVTCMFDYRHEDRVIILFYTNNKLLGRSAFKRAAAEGPVCATVALTGTGVKLNVDWTGVLFPSGYRDKKVRYMYSVSLNSLHVVVF